MRIGTVLRKLGDTDAVVFIDDLEVQIKCQVASGIEVRQNDSVVIELLPGGLSGVIIGVM